jgi:Holliday junction resolvase RusA-like endonuclease
MIKFTVYGEPVAQGRPKATTIGGHVRMYDPKKSSDYKDYVKLVASEKAPKSLLEGALTMVVKIYRPMPKSFSKRKSDQAEQGMLRPITKPDADNYLKAIKDALKNVIWKDDSQVVDVQVSKWYSDRPRVEVSIEEL